MSKALPEDLKDKFFEGESVFFTGDKPDTQQNPTQPKNEPVKVEPQTQDSPVVPVVNQPVNQSINTPIDTSQVLAKPKGFYITEQQDDDLDIAVKKLSEKMKGKLTTKIDRSTILRLIIEQADITNDGSINKLAGQLTSQLIRQLTG